MARYRQYLTLNIPLITMCGRYTHLFSWQELFQLLNFLSEPVEIPKSFNVAPTQMAPVIKAQPDGTARVETLYWGLIPSWANDKKISFSLINARAESLAEKPAFKDAFKARRCLVPVSGFYEWQNVSGKKQPWYIYPKKEGVLFIAGLWERWEKSETGPLESFTIVTAPANQTVKFLHDRIPVILSPADCAAWLGMAAGKPGSLLKSCAEDVLSLHKVSSTVGNPKNNSPLCIEPLEASG